MGHRFSHARPSALDAGLVRAHAGADDADAERRAGVACRQRRPASPGRRSPISSSCSDAVQPTVERLMRELDPEVVGLSVMTFQRRTALQAHPPHPRASSPACASSPAATTRAWRRRPTKRRTPASTSSCAAKATSRSAICSRRSSAATSPRSASIPGLSIHDGRRFRHNPPRHGQRPRRRSDRAAEPRRARARRLHLPRPPGRHRRDVARLHLRLQLLLDHRDARPQLPHLRLRARARRHRRRARPRRARDLHRRRQHHAERRALRGALPRDRRRRARRHPLHRPGDDLVDRQPRRRRSRR